MNTIIGNGKVQTKSFPLSDFDSVSLSGGWTAEVVHGKDYTVEISLDGNLFDYLDVSVLGKTLHIAPKAGYHFNDSAHKVFITMPVLSELNGSGAIKSTVSGFNDGTSDLTLCISGAGTFKADVIVRTLTLKGSGSAKFELNGEAEDVSAQISGSGTFKADVIVRTLTLKGSGSAKFELNGEAEDVSAQISGSGKIRALGLKAENADIRISGAGSAEIRAEKKLKAVISGAGTIKYAGSPQLSVSTSGAGSVTTL